MADSSDGNVGSALALVSGFCGPPRVQRSSQLPGLLSKLDRYLTDDWLPYHVIAVDDGGSDRTPEVLEQLAERLRLSIFSHRVNLGLGSTIPDGLLAAAENARDDDMVITMDADETQKKRRAKNLSCKRQCPP